MSSAVLFAASFGTIAQPGSANAEDSGYFAAPDAPLVPPTLYDTGNLGAAAMLFVMARILPTVKTDRIATFAFGPGVTVEWGMLRRKEPRYS